MRHTFLSLIVKLSDVDIESPNNNVGNHQPEINNNLFLQGFRPVVFLGRIFGLLSRTDVTRREKQKRKVNIASVVSLVFVLFFVINAVLLVGFNFDRFQRDKTILVKVEGFHHAVYACSMSFVYFYQLFASSTLRKIVQNFTRDGFPNSNKNSSHLSFPKFCVLTTCICLSLGMIENVLFDWQNLTHGAGKLVNANTSVLELSYTFYFTHWHVLLPCYNPAITLILAILIKLGTWGWVHMDTICITLCRALWEKLHEMEETINGALHTDKDSKLSTDELVCAPSKSKLSLGTVNWDSYQDQYVKITQLVEQVEGYICPLILACYAGNIYIIIVMLFNWIGPLASESASTHEQFIHICFAFFQYSFRVGAITYFAAEVHQQSLVIRRKIQGCPHSAYSGSVERLERTLVGNPTGICLLGSFIISRKYFISIISFIFTAEIVLLQTYSTYYVAQAGGAPRTH